MALPPITSSTKLDELYTNYNDPRNDSWLVVNNDFKLEVVHTLDISKTCGHNLKHKLGIGDDGYYTIISAIERLATECIKEVITVDLKEINSIASLQHGNGSTLTPDRIKMVIGTLHQVQAIKKQKEALLAHLDKKFFGDSISGRCMFWIAVVIQAIIGTPRFLRDIIFARDEGTESERAVGFSQSPMTLSYAHDQILKRQQYCLFSCKNPQGHMVELSLKVRPGNLLHLLVHQTPPSGQGPVKVGSVLFDLGMATDHNRELQMLFPPKSNNPVATQLLNGYFRYLVNRYGATISTSSSPEVQAYINSLKEGTDYNFPSARLLNEDQMESNRRFQEAVTDAQEALFPDTDFQAVMEVNL